MLFFIKVSSLSCSKLIYSFSLCQSFLESLDARLLEDMYSCCVGIHGELNQGQAIVYQYFLVLHPPLPHYHQEYQNFTKMWVAE